MTYDPESHHRRSIRLRDYDYTQPGAYFVTIATHSHIHLFGAITNNEMHLNRYGQVVKLEWQKLPTPFQFIRIDEMIIMPNHFHAIIIILENSRGTTGISKNNALDINRRAPTTVEKFGKPVAGSLSTIIRSFKSAITFCINALRSTPGVPVWQRNYYEHIIRNEDELDQARTYILDNPRRWSKDGENPNISL